MASSSKEEVPIDTDLIEQLLVRYTNTDKDKFKKCTTNANRVNFFLNNKQDLEDIRAKITKIVPPLSKCDNTAIQKRTAGNVEYNKSNHQRALAFYTQCLAWAKSEKEISLAYGNRSAALFTLGLYEECIKDIDRAINHIPKNIKPKLVARREKAVNEQTGSRRPLKQCEVPSSEQNPLIQSASKCIEIRTDEMYGKHIVASRDIKIGEILVVEKPFAAVVDVENSNDPFFFCHECFDPCFNLIPCPHCNETLYCGEICREKASKNYHKYECLILPYIGELVEIDMALWLLSLKITLSTNDDQSVGESSAPDIYRSDRYEEVSKLESHNDKNEPEKLYVEAYFAANIFTLIKEKTKMFKEIKEFEEKFKELLIRYLHVIKVNAMGVNSSYKQNKFFISVNGVGLYSLCSLFNHSCYNNVFMNCCGSTMVCRAFSTIKKGEQCFVTYGPLFWETNKGVRQKTLQNRYKFTCACKACQDNWPKMMCPPLHLKSTTEDQMKMQVQELATMIGELESIPPSEDELCVRRAFKIGYSNLDGRIEY